MAKRKAYRTDPTPCLKCGSVWDAATNTDGTRNPRPDDITICFKCAHIMAFDDNLKFRELTPEERQEISKDTNIQILVAGILAKSLELKAPQ